MDQIDFPLEAIWKRRQRWFEDLFDIENHGGGAIMSEHALGLLVDLQAVYCAGAFVSCIIIACTIIDAHLQDIEGADGGMQATFAISSYQKELEWLRMRRNRLVHFKTTTTPAISVDDHWHNRTAHEENAAKAIKLVAGVLFENLLV